MILGVNQQESFPNSTSSSVPVLDKDIPIHMPIPSLRKLTQNPSTVLLMIRSIVEDSAWYYMLGMILIWKRALQATVVTDR